MADEDIYGPLMEQIMLRLAYYEWLREALFPPKVVE